MYGDKEIACDFADKVAGELFARKFTRDLKHWCRKYPHTKWMRWNIKFYNGQKPEESDCMPPVLWVPPIPIRLLREQLIAQRIMEALKKYGYPYDKMTCEENVMCNDLFFIELVFPK